VNEMEWGERASQTRLIAPSYPKFFRRMMCNLTFQHLQVVSLSAFDIIFVVEGWTSSSISHVYWTKGPFNVFLDHP